MTLAGELWRKVRSVIRIITRYHMDHALSHISHHVIHDMTSISNAFQSRPFLRWCAAWVSERMKRLLLVTVVCALHVSFSVGESTKTYVLRLININRNEKDFDATFNACHHQNTSQPLPIQLSLTQLMSFLNVKPLRISSFQPYQSVVLRFEMTKFVNYCISSYLYTADWMYVLNFSCLSYCSQDELTKIRKFKSILHPAHILIRRDK